MEQPDSTTAVGVPKRNLTNDQQLGALADALLGIAGALHGPWPDATPEAVDYVLGVVAEVRRQLLAIRATEDGVCDQCGEAFAPLRSTAVYCSQACRQAAYRARSDANET